MKTYSKTLYHKKYSSPIAYTNYGVFSYIKVELHFDFKEGLRFSASAPNISFCQRNPFKAIFRVLEHQSIGYCKYQKLKEDCRSQGLWRQLK